MILQRCKTAGLHKQFKNYKLKFLQNKISSNFSPHQRKGGIHAIYR